MPNPEFAERVVAITPDSKSADCRFLDCVSPETCIDHSWGRFVHMEHKGIASG